MLRVPPTSFLILYDSIQLTDHKAPRYTLVFNVLLLLPLSVVSTLVRVPVRWEDELVFSVLKNESVDIVVGRVVPTYSTLWCHDMPD